MHRTDRPSIGIDRSFHQTGWTDRPLISISSIDRSPDRLSISSIDRSTDRPIGHLSQSESTIAYQSPQSTDRPIARSAIYLNRNRRSLINLLNRPIDRSPDRPSIPSIVIEDRLSIYSIRGRVFSILAYFSQSCLTRCDGRSDGSSVCQWTSTDRHSKRSYSIRPGCILKGVGIEEGYCTISHPIKATKPRGVLISSRHSFVEMSPT